MDSIETKMEKLMEKVNDYRPDAAEEVMSMQKTLKAAMLKKNFKDHPALVQLLATLKKREEAYSIILQNKRDLTEAQREGYFQRRDEVRFILGFFDVEKTIESIESQLDYQLSSDVREL
jgi:hypothetical protein